MRTAAGGLCLILAAVYAQTQLVVYRKVGDDVVLQPAPGPLPGPITSIMWRDGPNIAVEWDGVEVDRHRQFNERASLNTTSGELTITGLTRGDSALYRPEINGAAATSTELIVMSPVPTPSVTSSCDRDKTSCVLTCEGNSSDAEPLTYRWRSGDLQLTGAAKEHRITQEDSSSITEFSCELQNPVSQESSRPFPNPLSTAADGGAAGGLKISTGVTVFVSLLVALLLLVSIHRWKAGMWFFQKDSMPWEADFWNKDERPRPAAAESNGTTVRREKEQTDEETSMT